MNFSSRKLVIGATSVVMLGGAGGAVAATQGSAGSHRQAYIDDVAKRLNVSPSALIAATRAARSDQINALAAGRITQSRAEALKQRARQGDGIPFVGQRFRGGRLGGRGVAARYLGMPKATLRSELASGKSLAQIAGSTPGKSVDGLKAAIVSAQKARLANAVSNGWITSAQEQERLANLSSRVDALLQHPGVTGPNGASGFGPLRH
jgi:hypothetical protein